MSFLTINPDLGESIDDVAKVAIRIAMILGITVECNFNDKRVCVTDKDSVQAIIERYCRTRSPQGQ